MPVIDAFHLPALPDPATTVWTYGEGEDAIRLRIPELTPALLHRQVAALHESRARFLAERPLSAIVETLGRVADRFLGAGDPFRLQAEAALPAVTGYSPPMIRTVLDRMASDWRAPRLWELLRTEFPDPSVLDGFQAHGPRDRSRAFGPRLAFHTFSGNVPGVAVTSIIRTLLLKSATLGKTAKGEPLLAPLFARAIAEEDAELGACVAIAYWPGGSAEIEDVALTAAEAVIAYGGTAAIESLRGRTPPTARFLGYGHKLSFGVIGREATSADSAADAAARAAVDASTFDQQGCVSPHLFYVEEGGETTPERWAGLLAEAMDRVERGLPRGSLSPGEASAIRQLRGEAEFAQLTGSGVALHASARGTAWTVIYDPDPAFDASCLNRVIRVKPLPSLDDIPGRVEPLAAYLQTVGVAGTRERLAPLANALGRLGASRIAPLGQMAWPPPAWHHDGRPPLRDLVRWCDWEAVREFESPQPGE